MAEEIPWVTAEVEGIGGVLKEQPEDFEVEEVPAYLPSGEGEHAYLWVEKRDLSAQEAQRRLVRALQLDPDGLGQAGTKDRRAVTRQWWSVHDPQGRLTAEAVQAGLEGVEGLKVLEVGRHVNKLKTGHLRGNRFRITVRGVGEGALERAQAAAAILSRRGMPNFYGDQRFGAAGGNVARGLALLRGERLKLHKTERRFVISALQSHLFNEALAARLREGLLWRVLPGDLMARVESGGVFWAEDAAAEQPRLDAQEIVPTGPMFGHAMREARDEAGAREAALLAAHGLTLAAFAPLGKLAQGTRRPLLVYPGEIEVAAAEGGGVVVCFTLPSGSYATVLLGEIMKPAARGAAAAEVEG